DDERAPPSVNPSLWRHARLNRVHGLFKVTDRIWQVRGFDLANITIIEGDTGLIIIDPLTFVEAAKASLELFFAHRPKRPVVAVIYSHSHTDHYGGALGVVSLEEAASGKVQVIAPAGFMEAAVSENVLAGVPMRRRAQFQFGNTLAPGVESHVDSGLGKGIGRGTTSLVPPTMTIVQPRETHVIDGVEIVFQLAPESEAPAEMHFFFPGLRALNLAENATHNMHNLCPLRGAQARDALAWSKYLNEALDEFVPQTDVVFAQHHWPVWGREKVERYVAEQRDMYRFLHDQTLRLMSHGMTPREIAETLFMPSGLSKRWHTRGYYGAVGHNVKAIYQRYLGWYDGNPATLSPLPPQPAGAKYVEYMGGAEALMARARADFERGEYRWVVEVTNQLVFAQPDHQPARALCADAMEQLGYQAESSTWRNAYLLGARELREGVRRMFTGGAGSLNANVVSVLPMDMFFDFLAIRIDGLRAQNLVGRFDWVLPDLAETWKLTLVNGVLNHSKGSHGEAADAVVRLDRAALTRLLGRGGSLKTALDEGQLLVEGDRACFEQFLAMLEEFDPNFNILEP
ncbi:MAG: hypothetical protein RIS35_2634, partial [Pseudomonadota bacterium]